MNITNYFLSNTYLTTSYPLGNLSFTNSSKTLFSINPFNFTSKENQPVQSYFNKTLSIISEQPVVNRWVKKAEVILTQSNNYLSCAVSLLITAATSLKLNLLAPLILAGATCLQTSSATAFSTFVSFLEKTRDISSKIADFDQAIVGYTLSIKLKDALDNRAQGKDNNLSLLVDAVFKTATQLNTVFSPFSSIFTAIQDAFSSEAISRFKSFAELTQMYNIIHQMQVDILAIEERAKGLRESDEAFFSISKNNLKIKELEKKMVELIGYKFDQEQLIESNDHEINTLNQLIVNLQKHKSDVDNLLGQYCDYLQHNSLSDHEQIKINHEIQELQDRIKTADQKIATYDGYIDTYRQRSIEARAAISELEKMIDECGQMLKARKPNLEMFEKAEKMVAQNYRDYILASIHSLKQQTAALYAHFRLELDQLNARLNSKPQHSEL